MDKDISIYLAHLQSADRLDERRDAAVRAYGVMCIVVTTAATGSFVELPVVSVILWALLIVVALAWLATLGSLNAKLKAKNNLLIEMEQNAEWPTSYLTRERRKWETFNKKPLQNALRYVPLAFMLVGTCGLLYRIVYFVWCMD